MPDQNLALRVSFKTSGGEAQTVTRYDSKFSIAKRNSIVGSLRFIYQNSGSIKNTGRNMDLQVVADNRKSAKKLKKILQMKCKMNKLLKKRYQILCRYLKIISISRIKDVDFKNNNVTPENPEPYRQRRILLFPFSPTSNGKFIRPLTRTTL